MAAILFHFVFEVGTFFHHHCMSLVESRLIRVTFLSGDTKPYFAIDGRPRFPSSTTFACMITIHCICLRCC